MVFVHPGLEFLKSIKLVKEGSRERVQDLSRVRDFTTSCIKDIKKRLFDFLRVVDYKNPPYFDFSQ